MSDINCPRCGEPWEMESLHDAVEERYPSQPWKTLDGFNSDMYAMYYKNVTEEFWAIGCNIWNVKHTNPPLKAHADISRLARDIMGDDIDGIASMMEDAEYLGLFDE